MYEITEIFNGWQVSNWIGMTFAFIFSLLTVLVCAWATEAFKRRNK